LDGPTIKHGGDHLSLTGEIYGEPRKKSCVCINITYNYIYKIMV
jgi:hypothetical protein